MMKRLTHAVAPPRAYFLLALAPLIVALGVLVWLWSGVSGPKSEGQVSVIPMAITSTAGEGSADEDAPGDAFGLVSGLATPWAVPGGPGEIPTVEAIVEATPAPISLLGPLAGSFFQMSDTISFYWNAAAEWAPEQRYSVYLIDGNERVLLGVVGSPNLGQGYQLRVKIGDFVDEPGDYGWLIVLEDAGSDIIMGQSAIRPITLAG